jgi:RNA polymerase sigma-70 factor (ECF subfamily)
VTELGDVYRESRAALVAVIARRLAGDLARAEDAVQEAVARAAVRWPLDGTPERPVAWLATVAWRSAIDAGRRDQRLGELDDGLADRFDPDLPPTVTDDEHLGLILACCHPALAVEDRLALTLRHVAGLTEEQVASGLLLSHAALTKRLVRARRKIRDAGISLELTIGDDLGPRVEVAREVVLMIFNAGYLADDAGPAVRDDLCAEALWLARQLRALAPEDPETSALLALLLLHTARRQARLDGGALVPFAQQDPRRWCDEAMREAEALLAATGHRPPGPIQLQAAIVAVQMLAVRDGRVVPWQHVARLYDALARATRSPVVEVNRAVAVGLGRSATEGLAILAEVSSHPRLRDRPAVHAARAGLLEHAGAFDQAHVAWREALDRTTNPVQRQSLAKRLQR